MANDELSSDSDDDGPAPVLPPRDLPPEGSERQRRQRLLNENQLYASAHFVRRIRLFMRFLIKHQPLLGGKLTDYVIRYETQGRGSVHAHMLWWIDIDPRLIPDADVIKLPNEVLKRYGLVVEKEQPTGEREDGGASPADEAAPADNEGEGQAARDVAGGETAAHVGGEEVLEKVFNEQYLSYTNAQIWALKKKENLRKKLYIGIPPLETLTYV